MEYRLLTAEYDSALAALIRTNLKAHDLDISGTVYFDEGLDHLSVFYDHPGRAYYVLLDEQKLVGGIGLAEFEGFPGCCEMQKLYLDDSVKGRGISLHVRRPSSAGLRTSFRRWRHRGRCV